MDHGDAVTRADIEFHAATAHLYDETLAPIFRAHEDLVLDSLLHSLECLAAGREALDLGCGTGAFTLRLADRGFRVHGIDHSPSMLALAERKVNTHGVADQVDLHTGDVRSLPWEAGRFDLVTCIGVLHHLPYVRPCLAEAERVLRPGGILCTADPCLGTNPPLRLWGALRWTYGRLRAVRATRAAPPAAPLEVPDHEEGPIDAGELVAVLDELGMRSEASYWCFFDGLHRVRPFWLQKAVVAAGSRPWRRRSGNLVVLLARKPGASG